MHPADKQLTIHLVENDLTRGAGNGLRAMQLPRPVPGPGQALIKMKLRPINPADVFVTMGVYPGASSDLPSIPGLEGMGVVESLGADTTNRVPVGTRVVCTLWPLQQGKGTWCEYLCVAEEDLVALPSDVSDQQGAVALVNPVTVIGMFEDAHVKKGDFVLVTAAASALGRMAIKYGKQMGAQVIGTVRRAEQVHELKALGAVAVINSETEDLTARILEVTGGKGANAYLECVLGDVIPMKALNAMAENSITLVYGAMSDVNMHVPGATILFKRLTIKGFWVSAWLLEQSAETRRAVLEKALSLFQQGVFSVVARKSYPLAQVQAALQDMVAGAEGADGKIFLSSDEILTEA